MKKTYMCPDSVQLNMQTEQMIAASQGLDLDINDGQADQWTNAMGGWNSEDWSEQE